MANYNIKDIEQLSGIKAHTLRIWEKRYSIIEPKRTNTNIRFYDDEDLKKILNISMLNRNGYKISKIAGLTNERLNSEVLNISDDSELYHIQIGELIKSMIDFDEFLFEKTFNKAIIQIGFQETLLKIIYPFFKKIGILWLTGNIDPAQEHFISNLVRLKVISAIDSIPDYPNRNSETFVLFLQDNQWHEMGLLISSYLIKKNGHRSIYLGRSLPHESVQKMDGTVSFNNIVTTVNYTLSDTEILDNIIDMSIKFADKTIFIGGLKKEIIPDPAPENVIFLDKLEDFNLFLKSLSR